MEPITAAFKRNFLKTEVYINFDFYTLDCHNSPCNDQLVAVCMVLDPSTFVSQVSVRCDHT